MKFLVIYFLCISFVCEFNVLWALAPKLLSSQNQPTQVITKHMNTLHEDTEPLTFKIFSNSKPYSLTYDPTTNSFTAQASDAGEQAIIIDPKKVGIYQRTPGTNNFEKLTAKNEIFEFLKEKSESESSSFNFNAKEKSLLIGRPLALGGGASVDTSWTKTQTKSAPIYYAVGTVTTKVHEMMKGLCELYAVITLDHEHNIVLNFSGIVLKSDTEADIEIICKTDKHHNKKYTLPYRHNLKDFTLFTLKQSVIASIMPHLRILYPDPGPTPVVAEIRDPRKSTPIRERYWSPARTPEWKPPYSPRGWEGYDPGYDPWNYSLFPQIDNSTPFQTQSQSLTQFILKIGPTDNSPLFATLNIKPTTIPIETSDEPANIRPMLFNDGVSISTTPSFFAAPFSKTTQDMHLSVEAIQIALKSKLSSDQATHEIISYVLMRLMHTDIEFEQFVRESEQYLQGHKLLVIDFLKELQSEEIATLLKDTINWERPQTFLSQVYTLGEVNAVAKKLSTLISPENIEAMIKSA